MIGRYLQEKEVYEKFIVALKDGKNYLESLNTLKEDLYQISIKDFYERWQCQREIQEALKGG